jgi:hypothetical protein
MASSDLICSRYLRFISVYASRIGSYGPNFEVIFHQRGTWGVNRTSMVEVQPPLACTKIDSAGAPFESRLTRHFLIHQVPGMIPSLPPLVKSKPRPPHGWGFVAVDPRGSAVSFCLLMITMNVVMKCFNHTISEGTTAQRSPNLFWQHILETTYINDLLSSVPHGQGKGKRDSALTDSKFV